MIHFSQSKQSFYDLNLEYADLPKDLVEINDEQHLFLLKKISLGCYIFSDLTSSEPKPSPYHQMNIEKIVWEDMRTDEKKRADYLQTLRPLSRRQFKLALLEKKLLENFESSIQAIEDPVIRARIEIEYTETISFERTSDAVKLMFRQLALNDAEVDHLWEYGQSL